ncbi:hypothetical protein Tco_0645878 [Tanacetum coccineum]
MMYIETPYENLKDNEKRQLGKNNETKLALYNALPQTIDSGVTRFIAIVTSLISLDKEYSNNNHVRKFLRALPLRWQPKVTMIEDAKDLAELPLDEIIGNLKVKLVMIVYVKMEVMKMKTKRRVQLDSEEPLEVLQED